MNNILNLKPLKNIQKVPISKVATAFPKHIINQDEVVEYSKILLADSPDYFERMRPAFDNAGIKTRASCVELDWYLKEHTWSERAKIFHDNAVPMLEKAGREAIENANIDPSEIKSVITICTTGVSTPSLEAHIAPKLGLKPNVIRLPIFGLGCAGGVAGMARAADLCRANQGPVLVLVLELCSITFRASDKTKSNVIATALFGDGAAAMVVGAGNNGFLYDFQEHLWPDSLGVMGFRVEDDSFGVIFSRDIPTLVKENLCPIVDDFLRDRELTMKDLEGACFASRWYEGHKCI